MRTHCDISRFRSILVLLAALVPAALPAGADAADISVNPVRLFIEKGEQTKTVAVVNHSQEEFAIQVSVMAWDQDAAGADVYEPVDDIVVFPRLVKLAGGAEQLLRLGTRVPPGSGEKTYRVYVEEIPKPNRNPKDATYLRTFLRIGVPVFVNPLEPAAAGELVGGRVEQGRFLFDVRNTGNIHFMMKELRVTGLDAGGASLFEKTLSGWYLLAGRSRNHAVDLAENICSRMRSVRVSVLADKLRLEHSFDVPPGSCTH